VSYAFSLGDLSHAPAHVHLALIRGGNSGNVSHYSISGASSGDYVRSRACYGHPYGSRDRTTATLGSYAQMARRASDAFSRSGKDRFLEFGHGRPDGQERHEPAYQSGNRRSAVSAVGKSVVRSAPRRPAK